MAVFSIGAVVCAPRAQASTPWYVDNAIQGGANNGTSWANAWSSFAAINWSGVKPGDVIYVSGGTKSQTYTESWTVGASGTAGNPITIAIDAADPNHNGTAIFDYNADGDTSTRTGILVDQSYITFTGNVNGKRHFQLNNLRNILDRTAPIGIYGWSTTGVIVDHFTFINDNNPVRLDLPQGAIVRFCNLQGVRGDAAIALNGSSGPWNSNSVYSNTIQVLQNSAVPSGGSGAYGGPDGIQGGSGLSIYKNKITESKTSLYTSTQHPDMMQITGDYVKVYNNDFTNVGDSVFDHDCYADPTPHDIWIYNNTFRIVTTIDIYPEYFRLYTSGGAVTSLKNIKIMNNTFIDNDYSFGRVIRFDSFNGNPTASGIEIKNNIWYNVGNNAPGPAIWIDNSTGFTSSSFAFDYNVYYQSSGTTYIQFRGTSYTSATWIAANEPHTTTAQPLFVAYTPNGPNNDMHLQTGDTAARDKATSLAQYFTRDHDGVMRPQGPAWDIGAFEVVVPGPDSPLQ